MTILTLPSSPTSVPNFGSHALLSPTVLPMPSIRRLLVPLTGNSHRRLFATFAAAVRQDAVAWTHAPLSSVEPAAESLFHVSIDLSDAPELASSHTRAGQYLQLRLLNMEKSSFLAIASPPSFSARERHFQFLVKRVAGSTAEMLCGMKRGEMVELSPVMGTGFEIHKISPPEEYQSVLIFATGSAISPIRSLIESGFGANRRSDVRLYYGVRNLQRMAYQDRFKDWESSGVKIVPVLSQPDNSWCGEIGYIQAVFSRVKKYYSPQLTGAILCGQKQMTEDITSILVADGVPSERILKNF